MFMSETKNEFCELGLKYSELLIVPTRIAACFGGGAYCCSKNGFLLPDQFCREFELLFEFSHDYGFHSYSPYPEK